jgi:hypothetical protein
LRENVKGRREKGEGRREKGEGRRGRKKENLADCFAACSKTHFVCQAVTISLL